jgi:hypothetical protein
LQQAAADFHRVFLTKETKHEEALRQNAEEREELEVLRDEGFPKLEIDGDTEL